MHSFEGRGFSFLLGKRTYVMGILNVTPDSFSDGGFYLDTDIAVMRAVELENEGADIIDIGAMSTRPGHRHVSQQEEIERLAPVLRGLEGQLTVPVSVDTFNTKTAEYALENGASIINDVSGVLSDDMAEIVKRHDAGWIIMHTGGGDAETEIHYGDVVASVKDFFVQASEFCLGHGIKQSRLCFDVGFGFGKSHEDNLKLLAHIGETRFADTALMAALSRKRMVGEATGCDIDERLTGTLAANALAVFGGADFIRVHDVEQNLIAAKMSDAVRNANICGDAVLL